MLVNFRVEVATRTDFVYLLLFPPFLHNVSFPLPIHLSPRGSLSIYTDICRVIVQLCTSHHKCSRMRTFIRYINGTSKIIVKETLRFERLRLCNILYFQNSVVAPYVTCKSSGKVRWHAKINKRVEMITKHKTQPMLSVVKAACRTSVELCCCSLSKWRACLDSLHPFFFLRSKPQVKDWLLSLSVSCKVHQLSL